MAIYHLSMKIISRGNGQNAVASAAYRSGELLLDEATGEKKKYSRDIQPETHILAPSNSPMWVLNRQTLWNKVEKIENRVNSRLARELQIALPLELSDEEQSTLVKEFIQSTCVDKGMIADICIHRDNPENPHAHVMLTTREISKYGFQEKNREWDTVQYLEKVRKNWATLTNNYLELSGSHERIDHRSFKDQGIELLPTKHIGVSAMAMERQGIKTDKGNINRDINAFNKKVISLNKKREELLANGATTDTQLDTDENQLIVTYATYMSNQRELRICFSKQNYYKELEKKRPLSTFEKQMFVKAKGESSALLKNKYDYIDSVTAYLNGKNSIFVKFAEEFGTHQSNMLKEQFIKNNPEKKIDQSYWDSTAKRYKDQLTVRIATKIQTLKTENFNTIVMAVEKDFHFDRVKSLLKGWTNYTTLNQKLVELTEARTVLEGKTADTLNVNHKEMALTKDIVSLQFVKNFYDTQAISELQRRGFTDLVEKYDNPGYQIVLVKCYDELTKMKPTVSELELERRVMNNFKLEHAQDLIRGKLTGLNLTKRMNSYDNWKGSLERKRQVLINVDQSTLSQEKLNHYMEVLNKNTEDRAILKVNTRTLVEAELILTARAKSYLKENKEIKAIFDSIQLSPKHTFIDPLSKDMKLTANLGLFNSTETMDKQEIIGKMYDNIMNYKEHDIEQSSKMLLRKNEFESYAATIGNLTHYQRQADELKLTIDDVKDRLTVLSHSMNQLESNWKERDQINERSKKLFGTKNTIRLDEINTWLEDKNITAKTLVGATKQLRFEYNSTIKQVESYHSIIEGKIPALENMLVIRENKAIREVEKDFKLTPSFQYKVNLTPEEKAIFVSYSELKKDYGNEHLAVENLEKSITKITEKFVKTEHDVTTLSTLIFDEESKMNSLNQLIDGHIKQLSSNMYTKEGLDLKEVKEELSGLRDFKKAENEKFAAQIERLEKEKDHVLNNKMIHSKALSVASNFGRSVDSLQTKITQGQSDAERRKRLKSLQAETQLTLRLER